MCCFAWGFTDGALNIHTFQILGFEFGSPDLAFGIFNLVQGLGCFLMQLI
jgi:hypothetical protein